MTRQIETLVQLIFVVATWIIVKHPAKICCLSARIAQIDSASKYRHYLDSIEKVFFKRNAVNANSLNTLTHII